MLFICCPYVITIFEYDVAYFRPRFTSHPPPSPTNCYKHLISIILDLPERK